VQQVQVLPSHCISLKATSVVCLQFVLVRKRHSCSPRPLYLLCSDGLHLYVGVVVDSTQLWFVCPFISCLRLLVGEGESPVGGKPCWGGESLS
jgi:hypothetical protein